VIFTDLRFIAIFVLCWISFFAVRRDVRPHVLWLWGAVFYWVYAAPFVLLVVLLTVATLVARSRLTTGLVCATIVVALGYFKWLAPAGLLSVDPLAGATAVLVPLGFSFLAFELLHVLLDRRRGRLQHVGAGDLFAFAFFFPSRAAGPIKRYTPFAATVAEAGATLEDIHVGIVRVAVGLFKKLVLADFLALMVAEQTAVDSLVRAWSIVLAFSLQVYLDFSAYSDCAIGFSRMLGIRLPENFNWPYLAASINEFWNRWHISLSTWVRDYVFVPTGSGLFKTRLRQRPAAIAVISYLLTFLTVGLWHGLALNFIVWGIYHGALLALYHVYKAALPRHVAESAWYRSIPAHWASVAATFLLVTIGWVPFMTDWKTAKRLLVLMFGGHA
jgi:alginate O-acetyltransferase complex protein AlgI